MKRFFLLVFSVVALVSAAAIPISAYKLADVELWIGKSTVGGQVPKGVLFVFYTNHQFGSMPAGWGWYRYNKPTGTYVERLTESLVATRFDYLIDGGDIQIRLPLWVILLISGAWPFVALVRIRRKRHQRGFSVPVNQSGNSISADK